MLFIIPSPAFLIALLISITGFSLTLIGMHVPFTPVISQYYTAVILVAVAFITSRLLYITRFRNYVSTHELELVNTKLDAIVKEKTKELFPGTEEPGVKVNEKPV